MQTKDNNFINLKEKLSSNDIDIVQKMALMIDFIRPKNTDDINHSITSIKILCDFFKTDSSEVKNLGDEVNLFFINLKISLDLSSFNVLSKNGFRYELYSRFYNKFLPSPPNNDELKYIFATLFPKNSDYEWVKKIDDEMWAKFFSSLFSSSKHFYEVKIHLFQELLSAMEILSITIASREYNKNFIRLNGKLIDQNSSFLALNKEIMKLTANLQEEQIDINSTKLDFKHLKVFLNQCKNEIDKLKKRSVNLGISVDTTYELEYLTQTLKRLEETIYLVENFDTKQAVLSFIKMFKESVKNNSTRNSILEVFRQNGKIVAKSITNNIGEHGESYIADNVKEYFKIFLKSAGAGIIIAIMALIKINITDMNLSLWLNTLLVSLNYGLGFVIIHIVGFTVATKQPAMTASTFASEVEKDEDNKANQNKLIELIFKVSRSQFASVMGNVSIALLISFLIAFFMISIHSPILGQSKAEYYLASVEPIKPLFFAGIAGIWLFYSGLISGYFDNRADYLELEKRFYYHPRLKNMIKDDEKRRRLSVYLHNHHGAILGNFIFGVLLGITPLFGYLLGMHLDIAHVAFSSANLGYASTHLDISLGEFLRYLFYVLLIGAVNLMVSFTLALKVSLISRNTHLGNFFMFLKALFLQMLKRPFELVFPPVNKPDLKENKPH